MNLEPSTLEIPEEIRTSARNRRSRAVPERLGFDREGSLRNDSQEPDGTVRDTAIYARVR